VALDLWVLTPNSVVKDTAIGHKSYTQSSSFLNERGDAISTETSCAPTNYAAIFIKQELTAPF
jgi:hypothetical protein